MKKLLFVTKTAFSLGLMLQSSYAMDMESSAFKGDPGFAPCAGKRPPCARIYKGSDDNDLIRSEMSCAPGFGESRFSKYGLKNHQEAGAYFSILIENLKGAPINCFAYALGTYGTRLEELTGMTMAAIQRSVEYEIEPIVDGYFDSVDSPQDGDLVVYVTTKYHSMPKGLADVYPGTWTHAGIYRVSTPDQQYPDGEVVESKWGSWGNRMVFRHSNFFVPDYYGDLIKYYRIKPKS